MPTRAVYTFIDEWDTFHIYKHHDGYPTGAKESIGNALELAWELPRFEAAEFAAAFVAANKGGRGGEVYLTDSYERHCDLAFRYEVFMRNSILFVRAYETGYTEGKDAILYEGPFSFWNPNGENNE